MLFFALGATVPYTKLQVVLRNSELQGTIKSMQSPSFFNRSLSFEEVLEVDSIDHFHLPRDNSRGEARELSLG